MIREKIQQAVTIMHELGIDAWLIFGRESHTAVDPCVPLVVGAGYTWASAFIITRAGRTIAIVGSLDAAELQKRGDYATVISYVGGVRDSLRQTLAELDPATIAINYSCDDVMADGLTHGMYLLLQRNLEGTPYGDRLMPSERLVAALRGRKSPEEVRRIRRAIAETEKIFHEVTRFIQPGRTEREIHEFVLRRVKELGFEPAWDTAHCPAVFTGIPDQGEAHTGPTDKPVERGHVINMDFGLRIDDYVSDLQRTWYVLRQGETRPPEEVRRGFDAVVGAIARAAEAVKPGVEGWVVDDIARSHIMASGFDEYKHGLGHQVGRSAHDGAGLLCPRWERYGQLPYLRVEEGQVYTLEPRVRIPGHGVATVEEIVVVTPEGGRFLSSFQREIWLIR
jgi:Xaa-Pro aminopeptidase